MNQIDIELETIRNFILQNIDKDKVMVLGTEEMIGRFSFSFGINVNIAMIDFHNQNDKVETKPVQTFNSKTKEINVLGMTDKKSAIKIIKVMQKKNDFEDLFLIELEKGKDKFGNDNYHVNSRAAKTKKDKIQIIDKIFRYPEENIRKDIERAFSKERIRHEDEYIGYA